MAIRKVITRSKKTFRVKFPSLKNNCMIYCESILESNAALFLEISPYVKSYIAQPREEIYYDSNAEPRRYFPDFEATLLDDSVIDIEVKPKASLRRPDVKGKLEAIAHRYQEHGRRFRILTEDHVRYEPLHSNLRLLAYHRRAAIKSKELERFQEKLSQSKFSTVADATAILKYKKHVFDLIALGFLGADLNRVLGPKSLIWIRDNSKGGENDPLRI